MAQLITPEIFQYQKLLQVKIDEWEPNNYTSPSKLVISGDTFHQPEIELQYKLDEDEQVLFGGEYRFGDEYAAFCSVGSIYPPEFDTALIALRDAIAEAVIVQTEGKIPGVDPDPLSLATMPEYSYIDARLQRVDIEQRLKKENYEYKGPDSGYFVEFFNGIPHAIVEIHLQADSAWQDAQQGHDIDGDFSPTGALWVGEYTQSTGVAYGKVARTTEFAYWGYESIEHVLAVELGVDVDSVCLITEEEYDQLFNSGKSTISTELNIEGVSIRRNSTIELAKAYVASRKDVDYIQYEGGKADVSYSLDGEELATFRSVKVHEYPTLPNGGFSNWETHLTATTAAQTKIVAEAIELAKAPEKAVSLADKAAEATKAAAERSTGKQDKPTEREER